MMAATHTTFATHVVRLVIALVLSLVTLVVMLFAVRAVVFAPEASPGMCCH